MLQSSGDDTILPYTADPYGYVRRLTHEVKLGDTIIGGTNVIAVQGRIVADPLDTVAILSQIDQLIKLGCLIIRVPTPSVAAAQHLQQIRTALEATGAKVTLVAEGGTSLRACIEATTWADVVQVNANLDSEATSIDRPISSSNQAEVSFKELFQQCAKLDRCLEICGVAVSGDITPQMLVEQVISLITLARKHDFHNLILSLEVPNPILSVNAYRWLAARLANLAWDYSIHLSFNAKHSTQVEQSQSAAVLGSLLEDGIGDSLHLFLGGVHSKAIELAYRLVRRYTPLRQTILEKAGVAVTEERINSIGILSARATDDTPVVVAVNRANNQAVNLHLADKGFDVSGKSVPDYPYVISNLPDYRNPYHYRRLISNEVKVGDVAIGGANLPVTLARLSRTAITKLKQQHANQYLPDDTDFELTPDIYMTNYLTAEIAYLKNAGILTIPLVAGVRSVYEAWEALSIGVEALTFCSDTVGQIGGLLKDLKEIVQLLKGRDIPLFLISTHNAGQSWGSNCYHYWPAFFEAHQVIEAVEMCQKYDLTKLVLGIYTYNSAWNTQNYRLLTALMHEQGWNYPIHLTTPDLYSLLAQEHRIDASISLGGLLLDGIGDSIQLDYVPKEEDTYPEEYNPYWQQPLNVSQKLALAYNLLRAIRK